MKKLILLALLIIATISAQSQITLTATAGTTTGSFTTLKAAFDAINAGTHQGVINIMVNASTAEAAPAVINASGTGSAVYSSIAIYPTAPSLSISGNLAASIIDLNGANNVVIDGRVNAVGNTVSLSIINTSNAATAGTSTVHFYNNASFNTLRFCNVQGAEMDPAAGVIYFNNDASAGIKNNTIEKNNITNSGTRPINGIYFNGSYASNAKYTSILNNNFYDLINATVSSYHIQGVTYVSDLTISGNSFYETVPIVRTSSPTEGVISISSATGTNLYVVVVHGQKLLQQETQCILFIFRLLFPVLSVISRGIPSKTLTFLTQRVIRLLESMWLPMV